MRERLVAYLLNDLDPAGRSALEAELAASPELQQELEKVRQCLGLCDDDCDNATAISPDEVPPPQLASRTCCFVDHAIQKSKAICQHGASAKSLSESHDPLVRRQKWSALDIGAGIGVLVALGALVIPSLQSARSDARLVTCANNLHSIGAAVMGVATQHNETLPVIGPGENAGVWVLWLVEKGVSRDELVDLLICPDSQLAERVSRGCIKIPSPTREEHRTAQGAARDFMRKYMAGDYAFSMGYRDKSGRVRQVHLAASRHIPMFADAPSVSIAGYQSANHGGCGQNILYQDMHVEHSRQCKCKKNRDHLYLNDDGRADAGCHEDDAVLGPSDATPVIELFPSDDASVIKLVPVK